jgi:hypothetical protein
LTYRGMNKPMTSTTILTIASMSVAAQPPRHLRAEVAQPHMAASRRVAVTSPTVRIGEWRGV